MDKVSIITVTRNAAEALRTTMQSVAQLTYPDLEYIIIDGASTDATVELLRSAGGIKWISEPDNGIYHAMNKGVDQASGEWVIFMNAGDKFVSPDALQRVLATPGAEKADVIYADVVKHGAVVSAPDTPVDGHRMWCCHQSVLARRADLQSYPYDTKYPLSADFHWMKRMLKGEKRFLHAPVALAVYDTGGISNTSRSRGLADNMRVVCELEPLGRRLKLLPHLIIPYIMCRLRGK